ncbi:putative lipoprotein LprE [Mycobacterium montefiorense]|uniref:Lipoprotein LprE n=1 Tax=Mycobacterium montefiorense TaxID=154654 RepID=A0AA37UTS7_9MYCO|nr:putative lipoprotein LprE [Mycobacterium montefiorense]GKU36742.1 putative lipoprotein LprE [Mycobacterium montefiorense]GKU48404.1 putative lipoprotein LprE [Mycobacterium montefiorense]GKU53836.1 putative lipoprotein LprE [Mycobacterium montefiorense]GKU55530.1 putative lipoprotein LprE [Mycobacterium montefiorense]
MTASAAQLGAAGRHQPVHAMPVRLRDVWCLPCRVEPLTVGLLLAVTLTGCGSGDSTVAKTPQATTSTASITAPATPRPNEAASPGSTAPADPCAVNLASPTIAKVVSDLPRDPRSQQAWNPEPLAGNYNQCAQLSAVIIKANTNAVNATTRAVLFHLGQFIPQGVPDTYGFNGIDAAQTTGDTVALTYPSGINGLNTDVRFHWNGNTVELIGNATGR